MKINYVIVDASEFLKEQTIKHINDAYKNSSEEEDYISGFGHPLEIYGKMLMSDLDGVCSDNQRDLILYGYCINFYMSGAVQINLWVASCLFDFITEILDNAEDISYSPAEENQIGDLILDCTDEEFSASAAIKWARDFSSLVENSKEYKQFLSKLTQWQQ